MLAITQLECVRGERRLFSDLSFTAAPHTLLEVRGPNGSGKTSLLRNLCGLLPPAAGAITWCGTDIHALGDEYRAQLAYLGHLSGVKDELTAAENLCFSAGAGGLPADAAAIDAALETLGISECRHLPCKALSQGQRRRVALARLALSAGAAAVGARRTVHRARYRGACRRQATRRSAFGPRRHRRPDHAPGSRNRGARHAAGGAYPMNAPGLTDALRAIAHRDLLAALRHRADLLTTLIFFAIVASLFPLGVGSDTALLRVMGPGVVWVAALLASMLALARLFASDYADGTLEQLALAPHSLTLLVLAKIAAHWLATGLPLVVIAPLLGLQFDLSADAQLVLLASLLLGTPTLSLIGAVGAALTLGVRGGGALLSLLVLPLVRAGADIRRGRSRSNRGRAGRGRALVAFGRAAAGRIGVRTVGDRGVRTHCSRISGIIRTWLSTGSNTRRPQASIRSRAASLRGSSPPLRCS